MLQHAFKNNNYKTWIYLLLGTLILALGINLFIAPHSLAFGGVTGITIIIQSLTGIPLFASNLFISIIVILTGWFELGRAFMVKTVIPTAILPLFLFLTSPLSSLSLNLPLSAILGAITVGTGISLTICAGGSTAGPDTVGLILKKRFQVPVTLTMMVIDILVIMCGYHIYGIYTAAWSICVAILMNITVKLVRNILSKKIVFRYRHKSEKNIFFYLLWREAR